MCLSGTKRLRDQEGQKLLSILHGSGSLSFWLTHHWFKNALSSSSPTPPQQHLVETITHTQRRPKARVEGRRGAPEYGCYLPLTAQCLSFTKCMFLEVNVCWWPCLLCFVVHLTKTWHVPRPLRTVQLDIILHYSSWATQVISDSCSYFLTTKIPHSYPSLAALPQKDSSLLPSACSYTNLLKQIDFTKPVAV